MKRINLLPQEERVKASRERGLIWAILILVAVVVVLGLVYVKYNSDVGTKEDELAVIQAETAIVQAKIAELSPYAALQAQRTAMTETAKGIYESSVPFSILLQELSLVIPENVRLQTMTATVPATMLPGGTAAVAGAPAAADVTFAGQTEKHRDVAEFMTRLGLIPQLMGITLTSSTDVTGTTTDDHGELRAHGQLQAVHRDGAASSLHDDATRHHAAGGGAMRARGREIYIITAVVAVVLIVAWYFLLFSPTQRKLSDLDQQVQSAQSALSVANQEVVKLESYKKTAPQSRAEVVRLGKMLPESEGIPGLIIELSKTADASGVTVTSIARGTTTPGSPFGIQQIKLQVKGRYFDVEDFLYRLEEYVAFRNASFRVTGRLLQVTTLQMAADASTASGTSPQLAVTIGLNAYLWGGVAQTAAAGGAQ